MVDMIDKLLSLPVDDLKRRRATRMSPRKQNHTVRPKRSKEELESYIREHEFRSRRQLLAGRKGDDPKPYDYIKAFGSWGKSMHEIWYQYKPEFNRRYVIQSIVEFNLWTRAVYLKARLDRPDILPSLHVIRREFGSWGIMKEIAAGISLKETLAAYTELKRKLGRTPRMSDCKKAGLILDRAVELYGGKKCLDKFVETMEKMI